MLGPRVSSAYILDPRHFKLPFFFPGLIKRKLVGGPGSRSSNIKLLVPTSASFNRLDKLYTYEKGIADPEKGSSSNSSELQTAQLQSGSGKSTKIGKKKKIQTGVGKKPQAEQRKVEKQIEVHTGSQIHDNHSDKEDISDIEEENSDTEQEKSDTEQEDEDDFDSTNDSSSQSDELTEDDIKQIFQHPVKISSVELKRLEAETKEGSGKRRIEETQPRNISKRQRNKKYKFCILPD